jgi:hypothetical protein
VSVNNALLGVITTNPIVIRNRTLPFLCHLFDFTRCSYELTVALLYWAPTSIFSIEPCRLSNMLYEAFFHGAKPEEVPLRVDEIRCVCSAVEPWICHLNTIIFPIANRADLVISRGLMEHDISTARTGKTGHW